MLIPVIGKAQSPTPPELRDGLLKVAAGAYQVEFSEAKAWTIRTLSWEGTELLTSTGGNQAVLRMPDPTRADPLFIGNVHGGEIIESFELEIDGKRYPVAPEAQFPAAPRYRVIKRSTMGPIRYHSEVTVSAEGVEERARFEKVGDLTGAQSLYVFMHCWTKAMSHWLALLPDATTEEGQFTADGSNSLKKEIRALALWSEEAKLGAVLAFDEVYAGKRPLYHFLWNRKRDNKHYFQAAVDQALTTTYVCRITGFHAGEADWQQVAIGQVKD